MKFYILFTICALFPLYGLSEEPRTVRLQLKWLHQFQFAGYYAAVEKGYYEEVGLEVELIEPTADEDPMRAVLQGRADYGVSTSDIVHLRAEGEPVVALAVIYQHSPYVLVSLMKSSVQNLHNLAGKRVMLEPNSADILAMLKAEQIDPASMEFVPPTFSVDDLLEDRVDAMSAYLTDEPYAIRKAGETPILFSPRAAGIDFYGDGLFTTEKRIRRHPEEVKMFLHASLRGWEYALAHPDEIIDLILEKYSARKTREQLQYEAERTIDLVRPDLVEVGYMNPGRWRHILETFREAGMLDGIVDLDQMLYEGGKRYPWKPLLWTVCGSLLAVALVSGVAWKLHRSKQRLTEEVKRRSRSEARLREMEMRYREIFEGAPIAFLIFDNQHRVQGWNREAGRIFGWSFEEVRGKVFWDFLIPPEEREVVQEAARGVSTKGVHSASNWNFRKDGSRIWCKWHNVGCWDKDGNFLESHSIAIDMTAEREAENRLKQEKTIAESMNEAKGEILAHVSHEIRNPLNAIIGCSEILGTDATDEETRDMARTISVSAESLVDILNDLLDFSKIEAGMLKVDLQEVALVELVRKNVDLYRPNATSRGLDLDFKSSLPDGVCVWTDPLRLAQILRNLLSNAVKFTERGKITVELSENTEGNSGLRYRIVVRDTGIGISTDNLQKLFQPYSQGHASTARIYGGTGLGLALSEQLVAMLKGSIHVESTEGKGSAFTIMLPEPEDKDA